MRSLAVEKSVTGFSMLFSQALRHIRSLKQEISRTRRHNAALRKELLQEKQRHEALRAWVRGGQS